MLGHICYLREVDYALQIVFFFVNVCWAKCVNICLPKMYWVIDCV